MRKLYPRVILLLLSIGIPALVAGQCFDSAYFKVKVPYCNGSPVGFTNLSTGATTGFSWNFGDPSTGGLNSSALSSPTHTFSGIGTYNVCLIAKYANAACNDTFCTSVVIDNPPIASFTFSPNNQCSTEPVQFTNGSTGSGLTYSWNFGDVASGAKNTSILTNPKHVFAAHGAGSSSYTVKLVATNAGGCTDTFPQVVTVLQRPDATLNDIATNFSNCASASTGNPSYTLNVTNFSSTTGINTNYFISWGDGSPSFNSGTFTTTSHTYTSLGIYSLTFIVTGSNGCTDTTVYTVLNISNPGIGMGMDTSSVGCAPIFFRFLISLFNSNDASTIYKLDFGDGSPVVTYTHPPPDTVYHSYTTTSCGQILNQFTAKITAIGACKNKSSSVDGIEVYTPPVTSLKILPDTFGCVNTAFTFQNKTTGGYNNLCTSTVSFTWNFGDGSPNIVTTSTGNQSHSYTNPGLYWVKLSSENYCSKNVSDSIQVCVNPVPIPGFNLSDTTGCAPLTISATNTTSVTNTCGTTKYTWTVAFQSSTCNPATGFWSFAGGSNASSVNPTFLFTDPGTYTINLKVDNKCIANFSRNIVVKDSPNVKVAPILNFCGDASINPSATYKSCYGTISSYAWSFIGGSPVSSPSQVPGTVTYNTFGTYIVMASATNECGMKSDTVMFKVWQPPTLVLTALPDTICEGQSSVLSATGASTYNWSALGGFASSLSPVTVTPAVTTTYICVGTDVNTCKDTDSVAVVVNPNLVISVTPVTSKLCAGDSVQLTASGGNIYAWTPSTGLSSTTGSTVYAYPVSTTIYTIKDTSFAGCPAIGTDTVNVNQRPTITFNTVNPTICPVGSVSITAFGGVSYTWSPTTGLSATTGATVSASPPNTTTYTVTGTDGNGCTNTSTEKVTVSATIPVDAGPDTTICLTSSITLTPTGANTYEWSPTTGLSCTACPNPVAKPTSSIVYIVKGTDVNLCTGTDTISVNVQTALPVSVGPDTIVCPGIGTQLNVVAPGATTYQWSPTAGLSCTACPNPVAKPSANRTYIVNAGDNICFGADTINITLYPAAVADAGPDAIICVGSQTVLNPGAGASGYTWSPTTGLTCSACQNPTASPTDTTIYTVTVSDGNGCTATDDVSVNVLSSLQVDAGTDQTICGGSSVPFNLVVPGATGYSWSPPGSGLTCYNCNNPVATPANTTTYIVTATNSACSGADTVTINVIAFPVANAGPDVTICKGDYTTMNASGGAKYLWSPFLGISDPTSANPFASPLVTTTYVVTVLNPPCASTDTVVVNVDPIPVLTISNDTIICNGDKVNLNASGAVTYTWLPTASGLNNPNIGNPTAQPTLTTTYTVTGSDTAHCSSKATVTISVVQPPNANGGPDKEICFGESTQLHATGGLDYLWLPSVGLDDSTSANPNANPGSTIIYTVFVTNGGICPLTADTVMVTVHQLPLISAGPDTTIVAGQSVPLYVTGSGSNYLWSPDGTLSCATCTNPIATPYQTTNYIVSTIDSNHCRTADTVQVNVEDIITLYLPNSFSPGNGDHLNDVFMASGEGIAELEFFIFDRWGKKIFETRDMKKGWDGTFEGRLVIQDAYVYLIKATSVTGHAVKKTGTVSVIR